MSNKGEDNRPNLAIDQRLAERLLEKKRELDQYRPLPPGIVRKLHEDLRVTITYNSNAIEGNSLSLNETKLVIENGLTVGSHPLKDYLEATNHARAFDLMTRLAQNKEPFSLEIIKELHKLVMQGIDESAGQFRTGQVYITGAAHTPPPGREVLEYIQGWVSSIERGDYQGLDPVSRAAIAHHDFEYIHPFFDGNGRTGRLILNLLLLRAGYTPALIQTDWRIRYITALQAASSRRNYRPIINLVGRAVELSLDLYLEACTQVPEEIYERASHLAQQYGYRANYLGWLIRYGRVSGIKRGRYWYTTHAAIERYQTEVEAGQYPGGRPKNLASLSVLKPVTPPEGDE